jgi:hypothetical protein
MIVLQAADGCTHGCLGHSLGDTRSRCVVAESRRKYLDVCGTVGAGGRVVSRLSYETGGHYRGSILSKLTTYSNLNLDRCDE